MPKGCAGFTKRHIEPKVTCSLEGMKFEYVFREIVTSFSQETNATYLQHNRIGFCWRYVKNTNFSIPTYFCIKDVFDYIFFLKLFERYICSTYVWIWILTYLVCQEIFTSLYVQIARIIFDFVENSSHFWTQFEDHLTTAWWLSETARWWPDN